MDDSQNTLYKDCIGIQLDEVDLLSSIYCNPGEMNIFDPGVISDFNEYLKGTITNLRANLDYTISIQTNAGDKIEIRVELPHLYPAIENALVTIHSALVSKSQETILKQNIDNYISTMDKSNSYIYQVISWIQDNIDSFLPKDTNDGLSETKILTPVQFERLWIYSHHIKNKGKRQEIVRLSRELDLSGFSKPGKPGIICVEGLKENTQNFWRTIKSMHWHKITVRKSETSSKAPDGIDKVRRFNGFREELFSEMDDNEGLKISLNRQFMDFLDNHHSGYMKKDLFGFE